MRPTTLSFTTTHCMPSTRYSSSPSARSRPRGAGRLAWWVWLLIGGCGCFLLQGLSHYLGTQTSETHLADTGPASIVNAASIGLLVICAIASLFSGLANRAKPGARGSTPANPPPRSLDNEPPRITWGQFELLAMEAFRRRGFRVTERGSSADDGSRNLELRRGQHRFLAYCKAWRKPEVDIGPVRELYSMMIVSKAQGGFLITSGKFTVEARTFAAGRQLQLIDGQTLREMLRDDDGQPSVMPNFTPTIMPTGIVGAPTLPR